MLLSKVAKTLAVDASQNSWSHRNRRRWRDTGRRWW